MTAWLAASWSAGRATGSWTLVRSCRPVEPDEVAASMIVVGHGPDADVDEADDRRQREDDGREDRREAGAASNRTKAGSR